MFPTRNGPGPPHNIYSQPPLQPMLNQPQVQPPQTHYTCLNPTLYNGQFPPLHSKQTASHHTQLSQTNQQIPHLTQPMYTTYSPPKQSLSSTHPKQTPHNMDNAWTSEDDFNFSDTEETSQKHEWQTTCHKRRRINHQMSTELAAPITTNNRFESLNDLPCEKN